MPELPDVEAMRRYLEETSLHQRVEGIGSLDERAARETSESSLRRALVGATIDGTERLGKYLLVRLRDGRGAARLVLHFGMTGGLVRLEPGDRPPDRTRLLLRFAEDGGLAMVDRRRLGKVMLVDSAEELAERKGLGPDALQLDVAGFLGRLEGKRGRVKTAMMDQSLIAGVGNIYADEILFHARISPEARLEDLAEKEKRELFRAMQDVLREAVERGADPGRLPEGWLLHRRKPGEACPGGCGGSVERVRIGGRSSYLCPSCQRS